MRLNSVRLSVIYINKTRTHVMFCAHQVLDRHILWGLCKLERLVCGGDPIPMPARIGFSLQRGKGAVQNTQRDSVILSPDPQGLYGQPKHEACHRTHTCRQIIMNEWFVYAYHTWICVCTVSHSLVMHWLKNKSLVCYGTIRLTLGPSQPYL